MTDAVPLRIEALIGAAERPGLVAGAQQLSEALGRAAGGPAWPVQLALSGSDAMVKSDPPPAAIIVSLLPEVAAVREPIAATAARWAARLEALAAIGPPVLVCTVFRHIAPGGDAVAVQALRERIERLNLMAAKLSHALGVGVADLDRAMAHIGGRALQSDYRLAGDFAAEVVGHTIAWSLLSLGLDEAVDPAVQDQAKVLLGSLHEIDALVRRRRAGGTAG